MLILLYVIIGFLALWGFLRLITLPWRLRKMRERDLVLAKFAAVVEYGETRAVLHHGTCQRAVIDLLPRDARERLWPLPLKTTDTKNERT